MKKWCIVDDCTSKRSFENLEICRNRDEAMIEAKKQWDYLSNLDRECRDAFIVGLCNVEEVKPGCWSYAEDENGNIDGNIYEIAKDFCKIDTKLVEKIGLEVLQTVGSWTEEKQEEFTDYASCYISDWYGEQLTGAEIEAVCEFVSN
jgi:hypothetical protein